MANKCSFVGVTLFLDQVNRILHHSYKVHKNNMFTSLHNINSERFMTVLGEMLSTWVDKETLVGTAKRVGISKDGLNITNMQKNKFAQAAICVEL